MSYYTRSKHKIIEECAKAVAGIEKYRWKCWVERFRSFREDRDFLRRFIPFIPRGSMTPHEYRDAQRRIEQNGALMILPDDYAEYDKAQIDKLRRFAEGCDGATSINVGIEDYDYVLRWKDYGRDS